MKACSGSGPGRLRRSGWRPASGRCHGTAIDARSPRRDPRRGNRCRRPLWETPFPSLDARHEACAAIPQSRDLTRGLEQDFLDIRHVLRAILDPPTQPLGVALRHVLWLFRETPWWWIMIPPRALVVLGVARSLSS